MDLVQKAVELDREGVPNLPRFTVNQNDKVDEFALRARQYFNITSKDQAEAKDAKAFYIICRKRIEDKGVFVLHDTFPDQDGSGFCLTHPTHPVIVVNTKKQTKGRRLFTLIHELAHVLMGKSGISDPFIRENTTERLCNRFAGSFLVPEAYVTSLLRSSVAKDPDLDDVRWASRRLKISQEATVLRLEQLHLYKSGSYEKWKTIVSNANPDWSEKSGGPPGAEPPPQEKVKLAKYGFRFAIAFDRLLSEKLITEINLYRATGLKPKYQRSYFDYVKSISASELPTLSWGDKSEYFAPCYLNAYIANGAVITGRFGDAEHGEAAGVTLAKAFPGRETMMRIDAISNGGGGVHCLAQGMPKITK